MSCFSTSSLWSIFLQYVLCMVYLHKKNSWFLPFKYRSMCLCSELINKLQNHIWWILCNFVWSGTYFILRETKSNVDQYHASRDHIECCSSSSEVMPMLSNGRVLSYSIKTYHHSSIMLSMYMERYFIFIILLCAIKQRIYVQYYIFLVQLSISMQ